jgi:hypothetical protein
VWVGPGGPVVVEDVVVLVADEVVVVVDGEV